MVEQTAGDNANGFNTAGISFGVDRTSTVKKVIATDAKGKFFERLRKTVDIINHKKELQKQKAA